MNTVQSNNRISDIQSKWQDEALIKRECKRRRVKGYRGSGSKSKTTFQGGRGESEILGSN